MQVSGEEEWEEALHGKRHGGRGAEGGGSTDGGSHRDCGGRQTQGKGLWEVRTLCEGRENYMVAEGWYCGAPQGLGKEGKQKQIL